MNGSEAGMGAGEVVLLAPYQTGTHRPKSLSFRRLDWLTAAAAAALSFTAQTRAWRDLKQSV